jgi:hypothetical protein
MNDPKELNQLLADALRRCNLEDTVTRGQVEDAYREVVGELIVKLTQKVQFDVRNGMLMVKLASPALKHEISLKTTSLIAAVNARLPRAVVKKLVLL